MEVLVRAKKESGEEIHIAAAQPHSCFPALQERNQSTICLPSVSESQKENNNKKNNIKVPQGPVAPSVPGQPGPIPLPSQEQGSQEAPVQHQTWASGTSLGTGQDQVRIWACRCAWLSGTRGRAGQGCGELATGPAVGS